LNNSFVVIVNNATTDDIKGLAIEAI
jgi:hypothetical protein